MLQLENLIKAEQDFFEFFDLDKPKEQYSIVDNTKTYWTTENGNQHLKINYRPDLLSNPDSIYSRYLMVHKYRRSKGGHYYKDGYTLFRMTYSVQGISYSYFTVFSDEYFLNVKSEDFDETVKSLINRKD